MKNLGIFQFVELVLITVIFINLLSYCIGFSFIVYKKRFRTFLKTVKESWSKKHVTQNILSLSLLFTSVSVFWFMFIISTKMKHVPVLQAFHKNAWLTSLVVVLCLAYLVYTFFISYKNILKAKELNSNLLYLSLWNSVDNLFESTGNIVFQPILGISTFLRKNIIQSQLGEMILSSILWVIFEYVYKVLIVIPVIYLCVIE
jgi:hypothetical protein